MIVADDAVINRVGRVKLEIFFKVSVTECAERWHGGELSSSRMRCNFNKRSASLMKIPISGKKSPGPTARPLCKRGLSGDFSALVPTTAAHFHARCCTESYMNYSVALYPGRAYCGGTEDAEKTTGECSC